MKYITVLLLSILACFGFQTLALRAVGGRTAKSESNYFSSLGRIQAGTMGKPNVMLLGSSITGRLPDRAQGFLGFSNMGCDGGSAVDTLRAMDRNLLPTGPILVIEANTLGRAIDSSPSEVGLAMSGSWFQAGRQIPQISAYARPAAFFYSILLARKIGGFDDINGGEGLRVRSKPSKIKVEVDPNQVSHERSLINELAPLIKRIQMRNCRTIFVWLPPGREKGSKPPAWIAALVSESGSEWWDIGSEADPELVKLTDGTHMSASSAARTVVTLMQGIGLSGVKIGQ